LNINKIITRLVYIFTIITYLFLGSLASIIYILSVFVVFSWVNISGYNEKDPSTRANIKKAVAIQLIVVVIAIIIILLVWR